MPVNASVQSYFINRQRVNLFVPVNPVQLKYVYSPYWAKVWPAALGLCYFLDANPVYIKNKAVKELAAGLGLPTLFVAKQALKVYCSDIEPAAVDLIKQSVLYNGFTNVRCYVKSWNDFYGDMNPETLLLSDVNYEPEQFEKLHEMLHYYLGHRCTIIISTPQRLMAKTFIEKLLPYCIQQEEVMVEQEGKEVAVSVFVLKDGGWIF